MKLIRGLEMALHRAVRNNGDVGALIEEDRAAVRRAVLEEAAKVAEKFHTIDAERYRMCGDIAFAIRKMAKESV